jgi:UDP-glucose 4-epimerase
MHYLVVGGAGFIGSHVTEVILMNGHLVTVVDNLTTGKLANLPKHPALKFINQDIMSPQFSTLLPSQVDGIIHLAATPSVTESWNNSIMAHHNNLSATLSVIELCQKLKAKRLVFASSAAVYGLSQDLPLSEDQNCQPISPYGLQKLTSERYGALFALEREFSFVSLRLFNVYGDRQCCDSPYSSVIPKFIYSMKNNLPILITGDGKQTRDFVDVKDVANAFVQALTIDLEIGTTLILNIGTGKTHSILEILDLLKARFPENRSKFYFTKSRSGDINCSQANIYQASKHLLFKPTFSLYSYIKNYESAP